VTTDAQIPPHASIHLSIVVPVRNEAGCIAELTRRVFSTVDAMPTPTTTELVFVDDGSTDLTFATIRDMARADSRVRCLRLSRNMGHQIALTCGLDAARGDVVISMDGDLQHPPELLPDLIKSWREGHEIVNTRRRNYAADITLLQRLTSRAFYWLYNKISPVPLVPGGADFRLLDRKAVDALRAMPEHYKFYRGMVPYIGFAQATVDFDGAPRFAGQRSYSLRQSWQLATNGIFGFSTAGLKIPFYLGILVVFVALAYFVFALGLWFFAGHGAIAGWTSIVALIFLSLGMQLTITGVFGVYLARIFIETKRRPPYFVREEIGGR